MPRGSGYAELKLDRVRVTLSRPAAIQSIAAAAGITYREFKRLNPEFRADDVPAGTHELKFPAGTGKTFEQNFDLSRIAPSPPASSSQDETERLAEAAPPASAAIAPPKPQAKPAAPTAPTASYHTVKKGETLFSIAQQYKVSVQTLREANNLKANTVTLGQKLRIP